MQKGTQVYNWLKFVRNGIYPPRCLLCGRLGADGRDLCRGCYAELPWNRHCCDSCGQPLLIAASRCGECTRRPLPYDRSVIPFRYEPPLDYLLQRLKFNQALHHAPLLAGLMSEALAGRELPQLLLAVPMHPARLRQRGYNQAQELARGVATSLGIPLAAVGERVRNTTAQTALQGRERRRNLRGAFSVSEPLPSHVAIVDDVVTTGTTVAEFARVLRRGGAKRVEVWACARAGSWR